MDKETLSHYGWIVILILILSVLLALATPFGNFIAGAIKATTAGFFSVNQNAMNAGVPGIHIPGQDFEDDTEDSASGNTVLWIMSEDKYYVTATDALTMYNIDETAVNYVTTGVPDGYIPSTGDMYYTGEYVYRFNYVASPYREWWDEGTAQDMYGSVYPWEEDSWGAMVIDATKTSYSQIESVLFEYPVDNVCGTYAQTNIEDANVITLPDTVKYVTCAFYGCKNLKTIWSTVYVENWYYLYAFCTNLKEVVIPAEVTTVGRIFSGCESLETIILEDGFSAPLREYAFWGCTSLKNIVIPTSCTSTYGGAFSGIWSLTDIYYRGTEEQWASFSVSGDSGGFKDATVHYNYTFCTGQEGTKICSGGTATCSKLATCSFCGKEYGSLADHNYVVNENAVWEVNENNSAQHKKATTCTECGAESFTYAYHNYIETEGAEWAYYSSIYHSIEKVCSDCGKTTSSVQNHEGGTATCQSKAVCTICNSEYGDIGTHTPSSGKCTVCGITATVIQSAHSPYPNSQNYVVLGTWDYSDATSVNITITYQMQGTSYDWGSITAGTDYTAGNSYSETRTYLNTAGNLVSTTGTNAAVKFAGTNKTSKYFYNINMLTGSVIFKTNGWTNSYYGITVTITPNYE